MDLNLDTLKREILDYLEAAGFAVFHSSPGRPGRSAAGALGHRTAIPTTRCSWRSPGRAATKLMLFATREFEASDLDELLEQIEDCDLTRDEQRDYESRLRELRIFEGVTCSLELAFDYHSRLYVYEVQPDWYEEFLSLEDEIARASATKSDVDEAILAGRVFLQELARMVPIPLAASRLLRARRRWRRSRRGAAHRRARRQGAGAPRARRRRRRPPLPDALARRPARSARHARHGRRRRASAPGHPRAARRS